MTQKHKKIQKTVQKRKPLNNIKYKNKSTPISQIFKIKRQLLTNKQVLFQTYNDD